MSAQGGAAEPEAARYVARVVAFFQRGFKVTGLGLSTAAVQALRADVRVQLDAAGVIQSFAISRPSGNPEFDNAVRDVLKSKVGQQLPAPPQGRPDLKRSELSFGFTCTDLCL